MASKLPPSLDGGASTGNDYFLERIKLLVVMAKSFLKGYPLGMFRCKAMEENAHALFYEALHRTAQDDVDPQRPTMNYPERILLQRVQLLAVMCRSIAQGEPMGTYRKQALRDNIDYIGRGLSDQVSEADVKFLKVA
jgi:hypothetical protein